MSTFEFDWYNKNVKQELDKFKSAAEKLEFVFKEKERFRTLFRSKDADVVLAMFDDLIESIKIKDQFPVPPVSNKVFALSQKEISEILYDGLDYTPATRAQFYINKAIEMGYKPQSLLTELNSAYKTIKSYVFTPNTKEWEVNEDTGEREHPKQTINLSIVTGGRQSGFITYKTIDKLFIPTFQQMQYLILNTYNSKISPLINPTPPPLGDVQLINIIPSSLSTLFPIEKVFFIHYQCDKFEEGDHITSLSVFDNIDVKVFKDEEAKAIEAYCQKVDELQKKGLIPVHWDQNSPHFGIDHIKERYKCLTGKDISLQYFGSLNLAAYLIYKYGENYVPHRRLDNLARLNNFSGVYETENGNKTFARDRILLLSKIYFNELKGNLKINIDQNKKIPSNPKPTKDYVSPFKDDIPIDKQTSNRTHNSLKSNHIVIDKLGINIDDFFERIKECQITKTEIYNTVEKLTDAFEVNKLKILLDDFEFYFFIEKDKQLAESTDDEIWDAIQKLKDKGKPIPYLPDNVLEKDENGLTKMVHKGDSNIVNKEKLLYPYEFYGCYQFVGLLKDFINEQEYKILEANNKQTISHPISDSNLDKSKTKLIDYKAKLDFTLGYYASFFKIVNAIKLYDTDMLIDSIKDIKQKEVDVIWYKNLLTEQVHFDLNANEVAIFYKYGFKKLGEILEFFKLTSVGLVKFFSDDDYNRTIHELWKKHNNLGDFIFIYSGYPDGFIESLYRSLLRTLNQFQEDFIKSYSISSNDNSTPNTSEPVIDKHQIASFEKSAQSISHLQSENQKTPLSEALKISLKEHNFYTMSNVSSLSPSNQEKLIQFLFENDIPYQIAMFERLGFIDYFLSNHCDNKKDMHKKLAHILNSNERAIRGNINVLTAHSKEDKSRFTSHKYIETVNIDYNKLK